MWKLRNYIAITVWKNEKFAVAEKKFRQINSLVTSLVNTLFSRNFCQRCMMTVQQISRISTLLLSQQIFFRQINSLVT